MENYGQAISDIRYLRSILERVEKERDHGSFSKRLVELFVQTGALILSTALLVSELRYGSSSLVMELSRSEPLVGVLVLLVAAAGLGFLLVGLYSVLLYGARRDEEELPDFLARNFRRFHRLSFGSDLLTKLVAFGILMVSGEALWIPALFTVFTADYLFQGRLFLYSERTSAILGAICLIGAALQAVTGAPSLTASAALFSAVALGSTVVAALDLKRARAENDLSGGSEV